MINTFLFGRFVCLKIAISRYVKSSWVNVIYKPYCQFLLRIIPVLFLSPPHRDMGLVIQGIEPGGRVFQDGRLKVLDRIVEINGQSLLDVDFHR